MRSATVQKFWLSVGLMTAIGSRGMGAVGFLGAIGAIVLTSTVVQAATLSNWSFNPSNNQLEVSLPEGVQPRYFLVAEPARIVLDLPSTQVGAVPTEGNYSGAIQQIRVAQFQPDLARIVLRLSPDTVLAPGQVKLEKVGSVEQGAQRWTLRPLVADAASPVASAGQTQPVAPNPISPSSVSSITSSAPYPLPNPDISPVPTGLPPALPTIASAATTVVVPESASLPPAPRAVAIPVPAVNAAEAQRDRPSVGDPPSASDPPATRESARASTRAADRQARRAQQEARQEARRVERPDPQRAPQQLSPIAQALPPATFTPPAATVNVPALTPSPAPVTIAANDSIPFGQPLPGSTTDTPPRQPTSEPTVLPDRPTDNPTTSPPPPTEISVDSTFNILIPADTQLSLYYPQDTPLKLTTESQEEVLFLAQNVRDREGNLLIPIDSQVIGSFESNSDGSQFIARSIRIQGENRPVSAESDSLGGKREASSNRVVRNSAAGAVVGLLLGLTTGIGVLAGVALGAVSGAGSVFVSAPETAIIQPNQIVEVRVLEDLPR